MPSAGFESAIPASQRSLTRVLERATLGSAYNLYRRILRVTKHKHGIRAKLYKF